MVEPTGIISVIAFRIVNNLGLWGVDFFFFVFKTGHTFSPAAFAKQSQT